MPEASQPDDRTPARRTADHASLARLTETLVPALVQKLNASGLGELEVREGDWRIRLRRPVAAAGVAPAARRAERPRLGVHPVEREPRGSREAPDPVARTPEPDDRRTVATSPAVGVFRPGTAAGTRVRSGDRVGIVDLLGIPQDVVAPVDGTVAEIMVAAGDVVEYGEPVLSIEADPPVEPGPGDPGEEG